MTVSRSANQARVEISNVSSRVLHDIQESNVHLNIGGVTAVIQSDSVSAVASPVCDKGMVPCMHDNCCGKFLCKLVLTYCRIKLICKCYYFRSKHHNICGLKVLLKIKLRIILYLLFVTTS